MILTKHSAKCTKIQYFGKVKCQLLTYYLKHFQEAGAEIVMEGNLCKMCSYQQNHKISNQFIKSPGNLQYLGTFRFNSNNMRKCIGTIEGEIFFYPNPSFLRKTFYSFSRNMRRRAGKGRESLSTGCPRKNLVVTKV